MGTMEQLLDLGTDLIDVDWKAFGMMLIPLPLGVRLRRMSRTSLLLGLEFAVVFLDECLDHRSAGKNAEPLFLVEGDGETSHSVEGYGTLLADLETQSC